MPALAEEWHEADLEIIRTERPDKDTLVEVYVSFGNSPLLKDEAFIGYKIGITVVHRDGNFVYFWDSEGISCGASTNCGAEGLAITRIPSARDRL